MISKVKSRLSPNFCVIFNAQMKDALVEYMVKKEPQSFSHCGSFDHPDLQSLNECIFVFWFTSSNFKNLGTFNIPLERSRNYLSNGVLHAPRISKLQS